MLVVLAFKNRWKNYINLTSNMNFVVSHIYRKETVVPTNLLI